MNPSECCCAAEISVYGGEDPELLRGDHLVLSKEEQLIDSWLEERGIAMANPVDNMQQYFKQKRMNLVQQSALKKPSSLLARRKNQLKTVGGLASSAPSKIPCTCEQKDTGSSESSGDCSQSSSFEGSSMIAKLNSVDKEGILKCSSADISSIIQPMRLSFSQSISFDFANVVN